MYGSSEKQIPGVSGQSITQLMQNGSFEPNFMSVVASVVATARPGDVILTLGAGDVSSLGPIIVEALSAKYAD